MTAAIENEAVVQALYEKFGNTIYDVHLPYDLLTLTTTREKIMEVLDFLYHHKTFQFTFLTDLCGVHYPDLVGNEFCVVYHLHSLPHNFRLRIKVFAPTTDPSIPTASDLFASANWQERETYDFFGIIFTGHPNLTRILNMDEMDYFPMRREYPLEDQTRRDKDDAMFGR